MLKKGYKPEPCPFCTNQASQTNEQGIPVCIKHKNNLLDLNCLCGSSLDTQKSKYGTFFSCVNCGAISLKKAIEMNNRTSQVKSNNIKSNNTLKFKIVEKPKINDFL